MNIAVFGAQGRVGSKVVEIAKTRGHTVIPIDKDVQNGDNNNCKNTNNLKTVSTIDAVIDFSTAVATQDVCEYCKAHNCALISGVTGRNEEQQQLIDDLSNTLPVVFKSNFSVGINMLHKICEIVARDLPDWDCEIVEIHRRGKIDAPSGTAKSLASTIAKQRNFKRVTTHALRCGSNFGRHEIVFATNGESLTLTHQAENVDIFALGAVIECEKLVK